jgi:hypothetical protein
MEQLLQQVLAEKAKSSPMEPSTGIQQANFETLAPQTAADSEPLRRFKLNRTDDGE